MDANISRKRWQDQVILLLGLWLFITPWVLDYTANGAAATNAYIAGIVIAVLAAFDLYRTYAWAVMLNLVVGIWVLISPWVLKVAGDRPVRIDDIIVGLAVLVLALWELRSDPELHRQWAGT